jgi:hypothetical protein
MRIRTRHSRLASRTPIVTERLTIAVGYLLSAAADPLRWGERTRTVACRFETPDPGTLVQNMQAVMPQTAP